MWTFTKHLSFLFTSRSGNRADPLSYGSVHFRPDFSKITEHLNGLEAVQYVHSIGRSAKFGATKTQRKRCTSRSWHVGATSRHLNTRCAGVDWSHNFRHQGQCITVPQHLGLSFDLRGLATNFLDGARLYQFF